MSEFEYINDYERECTQKYEGIYTPEEIELNKKLLEACDKEVVDFELIEELLKQGADPLGATADHGWRLLDHVYGELAMGSHDYSNSINLPKITELFLKYGMDVDNPRIPYDDADSINPMWEFAFVTNENAIYALNMLLDKGISVDSFNLFWDHAIGDLVDCYCGDPVNDEFWNYTCTWSLKMTMLAASYDYILNRNEHLRKFIGYSHNDYNIHNFRDWNKYYYEFDTSHCVKSPELYRSIVTIYEVESNNPVWKFGVYIDEGEF